MTGVPGFLTGLLARWGIPQDAEITRTGRGTNNQTFAVVQGGRRWALRISENLSAAQVRAEHRLLGQLRGAGLPFAVPEPVAALDGDMVAGTVAGPATLCHWIGGIRPDLANDLALERFGRAIALVGEALRHVPPQDAPHDWRGGPLHVHPAVPDVGDLCQQLRAAGASHERTALLQEATQRAVARWPGAGDALPTQVVHGDLAASNMLVDEQTGEVTALLDAPGH